MHFSTRTVAALGALLASQVAAQGKSTYTIDTVYDSTNFFTDFDFFSAEDPTHGYVEYVDSQTANAEGLAGLSYGGIYMGVDTVTMNPPKGRKSVRVTSQKAFTHGLFIADIAHMPSSTCGVWPAFWMFGPEWPTSGEIDIIEGIHTQTTNSITLHTGPGCSMTNEGSLTKTNLTQSDCNSPSGCGLNTKDNQNYGDGFNAIGGGVYATEWTSQYIAVWHFPRTNIPADITAGNPNPANWGLPSAKFVGNQGCDIDSHFKNNNIVFDTTFCGDWAGQPSIWNANVECSALAPTCKDFVAGNPASFSDAYWVVNTVKVYQQPTGGNYPPPDNGGYPQPGDGSPPPGDGYPQPGDKYPQPGGPYVKRELVARSFRA